MTGTAEASEPLTFDDVKLAASRLEGAVRRTPVLTSTTLDERTRARVFIKAENFQRAGAFKFRGAYNKTSCLSLADRERGVITVSSGNHAQALALAGRLCKTEVLVLMPEDSPATKVQATRAYGAAVETFDRYTEDMDKLLERVAKERALTIVHPYDDRLVMAGQGTAALELIEEVGAIDTLLVCIGGGGLIAGCATAAKGCNAVTRIIGVEPAAGDDTRRSLHAGKRVGISMPRTIADGQQLTMPGELTFEVIRRLVDEVVLVSDQQILDAMVFLFNRMKVVAEPSGACALAALLGGEVESAGQRVGVIISGGNIGHARFCELTGSEA